MAPPHPSPSGSVFAFLESEPPEIIARLLQNETPMLAAVTLSRLAPPTAAKVLAHFPGDRQREIVASLKKARAIPLETAETIASSLRNRLATEKKAIRPEPLKTLKSTPQPKPWQPRVLDEIADAPGSVVIPNPATRQAQSRGISSPSRPSAPSNVIPAGALPGAKIPPPLSSPSSSRREIAIRKVLEAAEKKRQEVQQQKQPSPPKGQRIIRYGGLALAAEIVRYAGPALRQLLQKEEPKLYAELRKRMFVFEDLELSSSEALGLVFMEVDPKIAALSLRFASPRLQERAMQAVSSRRAQLIEDEIERSRHERVRVRDIEAAQAKVLEVALQLQQAGKILIDPNDPDLARS